MIAVIALLHARVDHSVPTECGHARVETGIGVDAIAIVAVGVRWGTFAAADSDPYGYVSEADLMARGSLRCQRGATPPAIAL